MAESEQSPRSHGVIHYNPVEVHEAVGTSFLGIIALALLLALLRSQRDLRELLKQTANSSLSE